MTNGSVKDFQEAWEKEISQLEEIAKLNQHPGWIILRDFLERQYGTTLNQLASCSHETLEFLQGRAAVLNEILVKVAKAGEQSSVMRRSEGGVS